MHSTIFSDGGPATQSVYAPARQQELFESVKGSLRQHNGRAPELDLPSAADIKCTQMAGCNAVIPGRQQAWQEPPTAGGRLAGKVAVVTGASSGLVSGSMCEVSWRSGACIEMVSSTPAGSALSESLPPAPDEDVPTATDWATQFSCSLPRMKQKGDEIGRAHV